MRRVKVVLMFGVAGAIAFVILWALKGRESLSPGSILLFVASFGIGASMLFLIDWFGAWIEKAAAHRKRREGVEFQRDE